MCIVVACLPGLQLQHQIVLKAVGCLRHVPTCQQGCRETLTACCCTDVGHYNENAFKALDQIIAAADKAGVKLILTLTDNWTKGADGKEEVSASIALQRIDTAMLFMLPSLQASRQMPQLHLCTS